MGLRRLCIFIFLLFSIPLSAQDVVTAYTTGSFKTNYAFMVSGGEWKSVRIPIPFYVIRHPQKGLILFDSGLGKEFVSQEQSWWVHRLANSLLPLEFDSQKDPAALQLAREGIDPQDVRYIIISHLHYDHAGGLRDFPNAKIVVSREEWTQAYVDRWKARGRGVMSKQLEGLAHRLELVDYSKGVPFENFEKTVDLFQDGFLRVIFTPGHTPGHQSLLLTPPQGQPILFTGDAAWAMENIEKPAPKSWIVRTFEEESSSAWKSLQELHIFFKKHPEVKIVTGHQP